MWNRYNTYKTANFGNIKTILAYFTNMIGFIDSGVGGLNVMSECQKLFGEDFVFLCDNKNAPYGNKNIKKLYKITKDNIDYLIKHYKISSCVIACNTLSYTIGDLLKEQYNIPIILTKIPDDKLKKVDDKILFFGTKNTIKKIKQKYNKINIKTLYIKNFPQMIDNNLNKLYILEKILKKYLKNKKYNNINKIVLCCTHFKSVEKIIKNILPSVEIVDYTKDIAYKVKQSVESKSTKSFHIVLTDYYYPRYIELKAYYKKLLFDK